MILKTSRKHLHLC